jgi:hypothetical protein
MGRRFLLIAAAWLFVLEHHGWLWRLRRTPPEMTAGPLHAPFAKRDWMVWDRHTKGPAKYLGNPVDLKSFGRCVSIGRNRNAD